MIQQGGVSYVNDGKFVKVTGDSLPFVVTVEEMIFKVGKRTFKKAVFKDE
jgi:hypothetical protein